MSQKITAAGTIKTVNSVIANLSKGSAAVIDKALPEVAYMLLVNAAWDHMANLIDGIAPLNKSLVTMIHKALESCEAIVKTSKKTKDTGRAMYYKAKDGQISHEDAIAIIGTLPSYDDVKATLKAEADKRKEDRAKAAEEAAAAEQQALENKAAAEQPISGEQPAPVAGITFASRATNLLARMRGELELMQMDGNSNLKKLDLEERALMDKIAAAIKAIDGKPASAKKGLQNIEPMPAQKAA